MYLASDLPNGTERRSAVRHPGHQTTVCRASDLLDEDEVEAGVWNVSRTGLCVLIESHYRRGRKLILELWSPHLSAPAQAFAEVAYALELPSARPIWMTGCTLAQPQLLEGLTQYL